MDRLIWLRAQCWLIHDLDSSRAAMWPPDLERSTTAPRPILTDAFCCLHSGGEVLAFAPKPRATLADSESSNDSSREPGSALCGGLEGTMCLDVMVVSQTFGMPPSLFTARSSIKRSPETASDCFQGPETSAGRKEMGSVPACYLRLGRDVFWLNHTAICRLTLPPLHELPENVPPYLDLDIMPSSCISSSSSTRSNHDSSTSTGNGSSITNSSSSVTSGINASNSSSGGSGSSSSSGNVSNNSHFDHEPVVTLRCWANASVLSPTAAHGKLAAFAHNLQACLSASLVYPTHTLFKARGPISPHVDASPTVTSSDQGNTGSVGRRGSAHTFNSSLLRTSQDEAHHSNRKEKDNNDICTINGTYTAESSNCTPGDSRRSSERDTEPQIALGVINSSSNSAGSNKSEESTNRALRSSQPMNAQGSLTVGGAFGPHTALALMAGPGGEKAGNEADEERRRRGRRTVAASPLDDVCKQMAFSQHLDCPPSIPSVTGDASTEREDAVVVTEAKPKANVEDNSAKKRISDSEPMRSAKLSGKASPARPGSEEQLSSTIGKATSPPQAAMDTTTAGLKAASQSDNVQVQSESKGGSRARDRSCTELAVEADGLFLKASATKADGCSEDEGDDDDTDDVGSGLSCPLGQETPLLKRKASPHHHGNHSTLASSSTRSSRAAGSGVRKRPRTESPTPHPAVPLPQPHISLAPGFLACLGAGSNFHGLGNASAAPGLRGGESTSSADTASSSNGPWAAVAAVERLYDQWRLFLRATDLLATHSPSSSIDIRQNGSAGGTTTTGTDGGPNTPLPAGTAGAATAGVLGCNNSWAAVAIGQWRRALGSNSTNLSTSPAGGAAAEGEAVAAYSAERVGQLHLCAGALSACTLPWPAYVELEREVNATAAACRASQEEALDALLATSQAKAPPSAPPTDKSTNQVPNLGDGNDDGNRSVKSTAQAVEVLDNAREAVARAEAAVEYLAALPVDAPGALFTELP